MVVSCQHDNGPFSLELDYVEAVTVSCTVTLRHRMRKHIADSMYGLT
jgi:hypothetical protein